VKHELLWAAGLALIFAIIVEMAFDVSKRLAVRLVRWSAGRIYANDHERALIRAREWAAMIEEAPKYLTLVEAFPFFGVAVGKIVTRRHHRSSPRSVRRRSNKKLISARRRTAIVWWLSIGTLSTGAIYIGTARLALLAVLVWALYQLAFRPTVCGVRTRSGLFCRRHVRGRLFACYTHSALAKQKAVTQLFGARVALKMGLSPRVLIQAPDAGVGRISRQVAFVGRMQLIMTRLSMVSIFSVMIYTAIGLF
jgi:hypothetical protein